MGLFSKPEVIILKDSNDAKTYLDKLKTLQPSAFGDLQDQIQKEIAITQAGIAGEENILFELKHSNMDMVVLHDIYIETQDGLGAQIDFIVVTSKIIFLIECKNLVGNIEIDSNGAFMRTITYGRAKQKEGIYSLGWQLHYYLLFCLRQVISPLQLEMLILCRQLQRKKTFREREKRNVVLLKERYLN